MYLHLGQDFMIRTSEIVGIFDMESATVAKNSRLFLQKTEKEGSLVTLSNDIPKSFVVSGDAMGTVYLSPLAASTLKKRGKTIY